MLFNLLWKWRQIYNFYYIELNKWQTILSHNKIQGCNLKLSNSSTIKLPSTKYFHYENVSKLLICNKTKLHY